MFDQLAGRLKSLELELRNRAWKCEVTRKEMTRKEMARKEMTRKERAKKRWLGKRCDSEREIRRKR